MSAERDDPDAAPSAAPFPGLLPWQRSAAADALARRDAWPHALLIHGRAGLGKHVLALHFAQALLCESPRADGFACGACDGCRYAAAGQHPDLRLVEPVEIEEDGEVKPLPDIPIGHIRRLTAFTQVTSHRRRAKVALIVPAERMNVPAANALLKTLEEPPAGTYLLLVSHQPGRLPATVRSRCRSFPAPVPSAEDGLAWLRSAGATNAESLLAQAGGAPLTALALDDAAIQAERSFWLGAFARPETLSPVALGGRIEAAGKDERRDRLAGVVEWLAGWTADLARASAGGAPQRNPDYAPALAGLAARVARVPLVRYHRTLLRQRARLFHPLSPRLVAESLLIDYRALFR